MDMILMTATILAIGLTAAGIWAEARTRRWQRDIAEKAACSGIRPGWIDEIDSERLSDRQ